MKYTVMAPGKLILLGEYAVLDGAHALVAAVDKYAIVTIMQSNDKHYHVCSENLAVPDINFNFATNDTFLFDKSIGNEFPKNLNFVKEICQAAYRYLKSKGKNLIPYNCTLDTSQFYMNGNEQKLGLGSSAALSAALFVAICEFTGFKEMNPNLFYNILPAYQTAQGNLGSGVDIAASLLGGVLDYQIKTYAAKVKYFWHKLRPLSTLQFLPIWSGHSASTPEFLRQLIKYKNINRSSYKKIMQRLILLANTGCMAYREGKGDLFLETVGEYFSHLKHLSIQSGIPIISDTHDHLAQIVISAGGVYKPSGAGGGDLGLAFCQSITTANKIKQSVLESGYTVINLAINNHGVINKSIINY